MTLRPETVLLTGFGPFPGVPVNASARFAGALAKHAQRRRRDARIVSGVLPTEWSGAAAQLFKLRDKYQPDIILHFGVSAQAHGFVIECQARNSCEMREDASGVLADGNEVIVDAPSSLNCTIPVAEIVREISALAIPCIASQDAGAYLCNAVLYRSLRASNRVDTVVHACAVSDQARVGFVHLPHDLGARDCPLSWRDALVGGVTIVNACLVGAEIP